MRPWKRLIAVLIFVVIGATDAARADIVVNVDQGATQPLPIAIPDIVGAPVGARISQVIAANLQAFGTLPSALDPASFRRNDRGRQCSANLG